jgi:hypothetical protein
MAAFSSSVFSTTSLSPAEVIQRCAVTVDVAPDVLATEEEDDARRLRRMVVVAVVVVAARGAHATATLRADAFNRNIAATILPILVGNMCLFILLLPRLFSIHETPIK